MSIRPISIRADRETAVYGLGEEIVFYVKCSEDASSTTEIPYSLLWNGAQPAGDGRVHLHDGVGKVATCADRPGFLRLNVESDDGALKGQGAAAVAPDKIMPSLPPPDDFDEFWRSGLAAQEPVPYDAHTTFHEERVEGTVNAVDLAMPGGDRIYGWLMRPKGKGSYPALVLYHGAGVYALPPVHGLDWVARGVMVLSINPHPIPNDQAREYYEGLRSGALADYRTRGRGSRDTLYFVPMFLRAIRAAEFMATLPEWDGRNLIVEGHRQGGGQALAAAAFCAKVTGLSMSCSTHCDHSGMLVGRAPGWPQIVEMSNGAPNPAHLEAARYVDGVHFASRIICPTFWSVCFLDDLCPASGNYAALNGLRGPKTIHHEPSVGHVHTDACRQASYEWARTTFRIPPAP